MDIEFGIVTRYFSNRGFGFVSRELGGANQEQVFFHISVLEQRFPELANAIKSQGDDEATFFWYEVGRSTKGPLVVDAFDYDDVTSFPSDDFLKVMTRLKSLWMNLDFQLPDWMVQVAKNTLSSEQFDEINSSRQLAISNARSQRSAQSVGNKVIPNLFDSIKDQEREFEALVEEIRPLGFRRSSEVSNYIVRRRLGLKYQHISGHLEMRMNGDTWTFDGGFPPDIYRRLCTELGLTNSGSSARPSRFTSYKALNPHGG